jgi:hypothetical protein
LRQRSGGTHAHPQEPSWQLDFLERLVLLGSAAAQRVESFRLDNAAELGSTEGVAVRSAKRCATQRSFRIQT